MKNRLPAKNQQAGNNGQGQIVSAQFSGPLPPPGILQGYDNISPGFAERIMQMAEQEGSHRREMEAAMVQSDIASAAAIPLEVRRGQFFAFLLSLCVLVGGVFLIYNDKQIAGTLLTSTGIVGIITAFYSRRKSE